MAAHSSAQHASSEAQSSGTSDLADFLNTTRVEPQESGRHGGAIYEPITVAPGQDDEHPVAQRWAPTAGTSSVARC